MNMERKRVNSSKLRAVGYDPKAQLLEIEFSDGRINAYQDISAEVHRRLMAAPNPATFYEDSIAEDYPARRIK
jgi:KTSC domain